MAFETDAVIKVMIALLAAYVVYKIVRVNTSCKSTFVDMFDGAPAAGAARESAGADPRGNPLGVASSLLPQRPADGDADFAEFAPNVLDGQSFLEADKFIGLNTVSGSLRIANHSIRANPPIPRVPVGPWNQSTVEADTQGLSDVRA